MNRGPFVGNLSNLVIMRTREFSLLDPALMAESLTHRKKQGLNDSIGSKS